MACMLMWIPNLRKQDFLREHNKPPQSMYDIMMNRERVGAGEASAPSDDDETIRDGHPEKRDNSDGDSNDESAQYRGLAEKNLCSASVSTCELSYGIYFMLSEAVNDISVTAMGKMYKLPISALLWTRHTR